jgi:hypothetical protein
MSGENCGYDLDMEGFPRFEKFLSLAVSKTLIYPSSTPISFETSAENEPQDYIRSISAVWVNS